MQWRVPTDGSATISGTFWIEDPQGQPGEIWVYIKKNATVLWSEVLSRRAMANFNLPRNSLNSGDSIYFGVSALGDDYYDQGRLKGKIDFTPTPRP